MISLLGFIIAIIVVNIAIMLYLTHVFFYNKKGLIFLNYSKDVIIENNDSEELEKLVKGDIPAYIETLHAIKGMLYFIFITLNINIIMIIFSLLPSLQTTMTWTVLIWTAAASNAFIIISFNSFIQLKRIINATCESYNVLIQSYEHVKEYENNGSPD